MRAPHIVTSSGKRAMVLAELVDVMPTVIELAGACESKRLGVESPWSQRMPAVWTPTATQ
jgi:arylsulfatase A-like enzyme